MTTIISKYHVNLIPLDKKNLEYVRNLRNLEETSSPMDSSDYITSQQQTSWYNSLDKDLNKYFVVEYDNKKTGVVNVKDIDYIKSEGEVGFFMDPQYKGKYIAFRAVLALHHFCFDSLNLKAIKIRVLKTNEVSLNFSKKLGYELLNTDDNKLLFLILSKSRFNTILQSLEQTLKAN